MTAHRRSRLLVGGRIEFSREFCLGRSNHFRRHVDPDEARSGARQLRPVADGKKAELQIAQATIFGPRRRRQSDQGIVAAAAGIFAEEMPRARCR